jgi:hypothetical protein
MRFRDGCDGLISWRMASKMNRIASSCASIRAIQFGQIEIEHDLLTSNEVDSLCYAFNPE